MWFLLVALQLMGCGSEEEVPPAEVRAVEVASAIVDAVSEDGLELAPITFESLAPTFSVVGASDQAPSALALSFARPVLEADGLVANVEINPAVEGSWSWVGAEFLEFRPAVGFEPETDYTASITSLTYEGEELGDAGVVQDLGEGEAPRQRGEPRRSTACRAERAATRTPALMGREKRRRGAAPA